MSYNILPTSNYYYNDRPQRKTSLLGRLFRIPKMDFEYALWQMGYLLISPRRVYRNIYYHKQTKNQWSRDDPAFIVLLIFFLSLSGVFWGFTYSLSYFAIFKTVLSMIFIDFLLVGSIISTLTWYISNKFLTQNINSYAIAQKIEWKYAFDVHCNSFIPLFIILYIIQLFFLPITLKDNWISMFIGNFMYCVSFIWYMFGTFLGFNALPFLVHTELFLYPIALWIALFIASLFGFNMTQFILNHYF